MNFIPTSLSYHVAQESKSFRERQIVCSMAVFSFAPIFWKILINLGDKVNQRSLLKYYKVTFDLLMLTGAFPAQLGCFFPPFILIWLRQQLTIFYCSFKELPLSLNLSVNFFEAWKDSLKIFDPWIFWKGFKDPACFKLLWLTNWKKKICTD